MTCACSARAEAVTEYVVKFGRDAFYESAELRKRCCHIRKVEPLNRALEARKPGSPVSAATRRSRAPSSRCRNTMRRGVK